MMRSDNAGDDRQAQPTARSTACRVPPPEALEGTRSIVRLHAWSVVFHLDHALLTVARHAKPDTSAGPRVDVARELREIDWLVAERPALIEASEEEEILD
jgi:hypothetical protein